MRHYISKDFGCDKLEIHTDSLYDLSEFRNIWKMYRSDNIKILCDFRDRERIRYHVKYHVNGILTATFNLTLITSSAANFWGEVDSFRRISIAENELSYFKEWAIEHVSNDDEFDQGTEFRIERGIENELDGDALKEYQFALSMDKKIFFPKFKTVDVANGQDNFGSWEIVDESLLKALYSEKQIDALVYYSIGIFRAFRNLSEVQNKIAIYKRIRDLRDAKLVIGLLFYQGSKRSGVDIDKVLSTGTILFEDRPPLQGDAFASVLQELEDSNCNIVPLILANPDVDRERAEILTSIYMEYRNGVCVQKSPGAEVHLQLDGVNIYNCSGRDYSYVCDTKISFSCIIEGIAKSVPLADTVCLVYPTGMVSRKWSYVRNLKKGYWRGGNAYSLEHFPIIQVHIRLR